MLQTRPEVVDHNCEVCCTAVSCPQVYLGLPKGMSEKDLDVFVSSFQSTGFTASLNWYRNLDRNWHLLADVNPIIQQPALMIYGERDTVQKSHNLKDFVPNVEIVNLDCGHWIQQEKPEETNQAILRWLEQ